ncbi:MAG: lipopolysaccharide export system protein LptA [Desulfobacteraceae bacterium Eth-SRB1]|nr:MAG: lipopolysaccharide export system protein LptA [Desulfobacteraceae bacterium Eth-SRB1]
MFLVRILFYNRDCCRVLVFFAAVCAVNILFAGIFSYAGDSPLTSGDNNKDEKIHITSDRLIANNEALNVEFIGNVIATKGDEVVTADSLKIFYKKGLDEDKKIAAGEEAIKKIIAKGNVIIRFDDKVAVTEQAEYITETGVLVLTGPNSKVTSGNNFVCGERITLYRTDDRMTVEGTNEKKVEAVFYSGEKGIIKNNHENTK